MCSLQCSLHEVNKGEQTRVVVDSQVTQHNAPTYPKLVQLDDLSKGGKEAGRHVHRTVFQCGNVRAQFRNP